MKLYNKFTKAYREPSGKFLLRIKEDKKAKNADKKSITFLYRTEDDYVENEAKGIGVEWEFGLNTSVNKQTLEWMDKNGLNGKIMVPSRFREETYSTTLSNPSHFANQCRNAALYIITPNLSSLLAEEPHPDSTVSCGGLGKGGLEMVFLPMTPLVSEYLRIDVERVAKVLEPLGIYQPEDSSLHYHVSTEYFGISKDEFAEAFMDFIVFLYENRKFMSKFCNRTGAGTQLSSINYYLDDTFEERTPEALKRVLLMRKSIAKEMLLDLGYIGQNVKTGGTAGDDRVKGFLNMVVNDEHRSVEIRWFGGSMDGKIQAANLQFLHAVIKFIKLDRTASIDDDKSMSRFIPWLESEMKVSTIRYMELMHVWNRLIDFEECSIYMTDRMPVSVPDYTESQILDFSAYEVADNFFQQEIDKVSKEVKEVKEIKPIEKIKDINDSKESKDIETVESVEEVKLDVSHEVGSIDPVIDSIIDIVPEISVLEDPKCCSECGEYEDEEDDDSIVSNFLDERGEKYIDVCGYCKTAILDREDEEEEEKEEDLEEEPSEDEEEEGEVIAYCSRSHRSILKGEKVFSFKGDVICEEEADKLSLMGMKDKIVDVTTSYSATVVK